MFWYEAVPEPTEFGEISTKRIYRKRKQTNTNSNKIIQNESVAIFGTKHYKQKQKANEEKKRKKKKRMIYSL